MKSFIYKRQRVRSGGILYEIACLSYSTMLIIKKIEIINKEGTAAKIYYNEKFTPKTMKR